MAMLEKAAGLPKLRHLPTAGGGPAITALLGNNAQASTQTVQATLPHIKAGKLRRWRHSERSDRRRFPTCRR